MIKEKGPAMFPEGLNDNMKRYLGLDITKEKLKSHFLTVGGQT